MIWVVAYVVCAIVTGHLNGRCMALTPPDEVV